ncbi:CfaE/CblD family pilus tip adhesin [Kluyvera intermedia]|uniref:CfaE/CblD family pilus tip adhesin n=1 Tax=Kluyvera intermedia TaxID=61648 RepID=UPI000ABC5849|nr:CfaE/CblD family pilus tip adhesin [Kluyvera intermedia]WQD30590.1 CfaE/CblD family pilus tip adhesin [Kluyvera intermedia]VDZ86587.1 Colonization factor antigen I subunit E [Kluyvera intermedia]
MKLIQLALIGGLLFSGYAAANGVYPVMTNNIPVLQEYELPSGAPADDYIWDYGYIGAYGYSQRSFPFNCNYADLQQSCTHQSHSSTITIMLTERRSGMRFPLKLQGYLNMYYYDDQDPDSSFICGGNFPLNDNQYASCYNSTSSFTSNSRLLTVYIPQSEMNNLPVGGVWEGHLQLITGGNWSGHKYTADITLKGKATGKQDIYFPEFNSANPLVQLDLHPTGSVTSNSYVEDVTNLDMCLYDGFNSNSDSMDLSFKDEGKTAAARKDGYFSIYNTATGGTDEAERVDYRVEMFDPHSKGWRTVKNNDAFTLQAGENGQDQIRPVRLPSITYPVLCSPAPLRLIVDKFRVTDKAAGYYKGVLTVEFSPSLNSI